MQTKLAFLFILHVMLIGLFFAWRGARLNIPNSLLMTLYFVVFYMLAGLALDVFPALIVPAVEATGP